MNNKRNWIYIHLLRVDFARVINHPDLYATKERVKEIRMQDIWQDVLANRPEKMRWDTQMYFKEESYRFGAGVRFVKVAAKSEDSTLESFAEYILRVNNILLPAERKGNRNPYFTYYKDIRERDWKDVFNKDIELIENGVKEGPRIRRGYFFETNLYSPKPLSEAYEDYVSPQIKQPIISKKEEVDYQEHGKLQLWWAIFGGVILLLVVLVYWQGGKFYSSENITKEAETTFEKSISEKKTFSVAEEITFEREVPRKQNAITAEIIIMNTVLHVAVLPFVKKNKFDNDLIGDDIYREFLEYKKKWGGIRVSYLDQYQFSRMPNDDTLSAIIDSSGIDILVFGRASLDCSKESICFDYKLGRYSRHGIGSPDAFQTKLDYEKSPKRESSEGSFSGDRQNLKGWLAVYLLIRERDYKSAVQELHSFAELGTKADLWEVYSFALKAETGLYTRNKINAKDTSILVLLDYLISTSTDSDQIEHFIGDKGRRLIGYKEEYQKFANNSFKKNPNYYRQKLELAKSLSEKVELLKLAKRRGAIHTEMILFDLYVKERRWDEAIEVGELILNDEKMIKQWEERYALRGFKRSVQPIRLKLAEMYASIGNYKRASSLLEKYNLDESLVISSSSFEMHFELLKKVEENHPFLGAESLYEDVVSQYVENIALFYDKTGALYLDDVVIDELWVMDWLLLKSYWAVFIQKDKEKGHFLLNNTNTFESTLYRALAANYSGIYEGVLGNMPDLIDCLTYINSDKIHSLYIFQVKNCIDNGIGQDCLEKYKEELQVIGRACLDQRYKEKVIEEGLENVVFDIINSNNCSFPILDSFYTLNEYHCASIEQRNNCYLIQQFAINLEREFIEKCVRNHPIQ